MDSAMCVVHTLEQLPIGLKNHGRMADSARKDLAALGPSRASTSAPPSWSSCLPSEDLTWLKIWRARARYQEAGQGRNIPPVRG